MGDFVRKDEVQKIREDFKAWVRAEMEAPHMAGPQSQDVPGSRRMIDRLLRWIEVEEMLRPSPAQVAKYVDNLETLATLQGLRTGDVAPDADIVEVHEWLKGIVAGEYA